MTILHTFWIPYEKGYKSPELNGINVWLQRLQANANEDALLRSINLGCCDGPFTPPDWVDEWATGLGEGNRLLHRLLPTADLLAINGCYDWLSVIASSRRLMAGRPPTIAFVHNDNEFEYYLPLMYFESLIDHFVAVSPECAAHLAERLPSRHADISVLPYFVPTPKLIDAEPHKTSSRLDKLRLLYAGRVQQTQKRVFDFVALMEKLVEIGIPASLTVCGDGIDLERLRTLFCEKQLGEHVEFWGCIAPDQIGRVMRDHDVFVQVSEFEGTSTSMLEALANGLPPVVTHASSGIDGIVCDGENGFVVPVGNMDLLADRLATIYRSPQLFEKLRIAAINTGREYGWPNYQKRLSDICQAAIQAAKSASRVCSIEPVPAKVPWARCWFANQERQSGRLDHIPLPASARRLLRNLRRILSGS